ncbi:MAG: carbohydrate-binding protein, partial [Bacteroidales bacterium]|nr:carbohydrate-binding protein [Bacteroidales bacterium]
MEIAGESRVTSIIKGDGTRPTDDGIVGRSYSAIRFDKSPDVYIHDLRSLDPMKFHIGGGFGNVLVERCDLIESRGEHSSDGIHGGAQRVIVRDCYIDTWDDALYTRECTLVENTTIVHNKNGSPFMTSWGASIENGDECIIKNCTVIDNSNEGYNHGVVGWAGKHDSAPQTINLNFQGTFTRTTAAGKQASPMYTIGRPGGDLIENANIKVEGLCPSPNSIELRSGAVNCNVQFVNCNSSVAQSIAGKIEAESFNNQFGVQTESTSDIGGGMNIGWIQAGDWTEYDVDVTQNGSYDVDVRVASGASGGTITIIANGTNVGSVTVPNTGGWQNWATVSTNIALNAGQQTLKLSYNGGAGFLFNLNWVDFIRPNNAPIGEIISLQGNNGSYVSSEDGSAAMMCNRMTVGAWEEFTVVDAGNGKIALKGTNEKYINNGVPMWCSETTVTTAASFTWTDAGNGQVALKGSNNKFVSSENGLNPMNCNRTSIGTWEKFTWNIIPKSAPGINSKNITSTAKLYPNPVSSILTIELSKYPENTQIEIFNSLG